MCWPSDNAANGKKGPFDDGGAFDFTAQKSKPIPLVRAFEVCLAIAASPTYYFTASAEIVRE